MSPCRWLTMGAFFLYFPHCYEHLMHRHCRSFLVYRFVCLSKSHLAKMYLAPWFAFRYVLLCFAFGTTLGASAIVVTRSSIMLTFEAFTSLFSRIDLSPHHQAQAIYDAPPSKPVLANKNDDDSDVSFELVLFHSVHPTWAPLGFRRR